MTLRIEDPELLKGEAIFTVDVTAQGWLHAVFVRSSEPSGTLSVETAKAANSPGVVRIFTAGDLDLPPMPAFPPVLNQDMPQPLLAHDRVRFLGEPLALILATTREAAFDAAQLVAVKITADECVVDPWQARDGNRLVHPAAGTNVALDLHFARPLRGELFEGCDVVIETEVTNQRLAAAGLEPRTVIASWDGDTLHFQAGSQAPHLWRDDLANLLGLATEQVVVQVHDIGGAFGSRALVNPEDVLIAWAARELHGTVRWEEPRRESFAVFGHGRAQTARIRLGGDRNGTITAYEVDAVQDCGAYPKIGAVLPFWTRSGLTGPYDIRKARFTSASVTTHTAPVVAYRGAGQPEAVYMLEVAVDEFAREIGIDPAEVRRLNFVPVDQMPYTTVTRVTYDSGDFHGALAGALSAIDYDQVRRQQQAAAASGSTTLIGVGLASFVEVTGPDVRPEWAGIEVDADGSITVRTGTSSSGQGHATVWATLVTDKLGVPRAAVHLDRTDTSVMPMGGGTGGSRSVQTAGPALILALEELVSAGAKVIASELALDPSTVTYQASSATFTSEDRAWSWGQVALMAGGSLEASATYTPTAPTCPYGTHAAVVEIDTQTGQVKVVRYVAVDDAGTIITPDLAEGQVRGGVAQGVAQAVYEAVDYSDSGRPRQNYTSYGTPTAADLPSWETHFIQSPTPLNPLGAKGIGESGALAAPAAIHNAVADALAQRSWYPLAMPFTPERVWAAMRSPSEAAKPDMPHPTAAGA